MAVTRRAAIAGALALPRFARAAEFNWRIAHTAPVGFPLHVRLREAAEEIARQSDGRMNIAVLPENAAGSQIGLLGQIRNGGGVEIAPLSGQILASALTAAAAPMAGFAFASYDKLWPALDGDLGRLVREQMQLRLGMTAMTRMWDFAFRHITSSAKPVRVAADLAGQRIRTGDDGDAVGLFRTLKAAPASMRLGDLFSALRKGSIDGQEGPLPLIATARLYDVQPDCALTRHIWDGQWMCINGAAWARLPDKLKLVVADALDSAALRQRADSLLLEQETSEFLSVQGMIVATVDPGSFRDALRTAGYYAALRARFGDRIWTALEGHAGPLA